ncbi:natural resistance-associated macrophage protein [Cylindrobasidium torrendii FP15055 ss-10]|uniref:Natural resistance-associated macrophage protein n=1 Tax=Cylindrobasidium torrendii FP15055 ss-10 TaxID=1314674 RepID=A0A0D7BR01_9AGAR|nr:natural resistance-associated macrophage protein [Cylindrobasidium torrendii FP15055 ss-10]
MLSLRLKQSGLALFNHARRHTGVGIVCAVAYFDPGNWGVDLQAGSQFGYSLLFVVLLAGIFAIFFQVSASRLGVVTGLDLASYCRLLLHDRPKHTMFYRWGLLYPLYVLSEIAIIATDLAELLGSAIALSMLFPQLELWHGVLITTVDVVFILALGDPLNGRPVKSFELLIGCLVLAVLICMCIIISRVNADWGDVFFGYLPSKYVAQSGSSVYTSVGIIGATVMPHSLYLGSALATQNRLTPEEIDEADTLGSNSISTGSEVSLTTEKKKTAKAYVSTYFSQMTIKIKHIFDAPPPSEYSTNAKNHKERENNSFLFVKGHLYSGIIDIVTSLLGFAVVINSLILILAGAVFFTKGINRDGTASLFDAYDLIKETIGASAATLFAIALLAAGQSSSIIATVAGQAVSEGFLQWRTNPIVRRLVTRLLALIPSLVVAVSVGRSGIDALLVASQVVLSIVLPFVALPLIYMTSRFSGIMLVRAPSDSPNALHAAASRSEDTVVVDAEGAEQWKDFSNGWILTGVCGAIWLLIAMANIYVVAELALGNA